MTDTIAAVATAPGVGGIAIVRVSGPQAVEVAERVIRLPKGRLTRAAPWRLRLGWAEDEGGRRLDQVLAVVMRGPRSYTREDMVEVHCHGGAAAAGAVLAQLVAAGARPAGPGEFTRRAFLNGRLDLAQAEAILGLVNARAEGGLRVAAGQLAGGLSAEVRRLRGGLLQVAASLAVAIDFPEDVEVEPPKLAAIRTELAALVETGRAGQIIRQGFSVVIAGRPNAGKSSLFNALLGADRAIVTEHAGTTRDFITEAVDWDGLPVTLTDTAGLRETAEPVEALGVERARQAVAAADLILGVVDAAGDPPDSGVLQELEPERTLSVWTKTDLRAPAGPGLAVSALTGEGIPELRRAIAAHSGAAVAMAGGGGPCLVSLRHQGAAARALAAVDRAEGGLRAGLPWELVALDVNEAVEALGEVTGESLRDDLLEQVFAQFCIGK